MSKIPYSQTKPDKHIKINDTEGLVSKFDGLSISKYDIGNKHLSTDIYNILKQYIELVRTEKDEKSHDFLQYIIVELQDKIQEYQYNIPEIDEVISKTLKSVQDKLKSQSNPETDIDDDSIKELVSDILQIISDIKTERYSESSSTKATPKDSNQSSDKDIDIDYVFDVISKHQNAKKFENKIHEELLKCNNSTINIFRTNCIKTRDKITKVLLPFVKNNRLKINLSKVGVHNRNGINSKGNLQKITHGLNNTVDKKTTQKHNKKIDNKLKSIRSVISSIGASVKKIGLFVGNMVSGIFTGTCKLITKSIKHVGAFIFKTFKALGGVFLGVLKIFKVGTLFKGLFRNLKDLSVLICAALKNTLTAFLMSPNGQYMIGYIAGYIVNKVKSFFSGTSIVEGAINVLTKVFDYLTTIKDDILDKIYPLYESVINGSKGLTEWFTSVCGKVQDYWHIFSEILAWAPVIIRGVMCFHGGGVTGLFQALVAYGVRVGTKASMEPFTTYTDNWDNDSKMFSLNYIKDVVHIGFSKLHTNVVKNFNANFNNGELSKQWKSIFHNVIQNISHDYNTLYSIYSRLQDYSCDSPAELNAYLLPYFMDNRTYYFEPNDPKFISQYLQTKGNDMNVTDWLKFLLIGMARLTGMMRVLHTNNKSTLTYASSIFSDDELRWDYHRRMKFMNDKFSSDWIDHGTGIFDYISTLSTDKMNEVLSGIGGNNELLLRKLKVQKLPDGVSIEDAKKELKDRKDLYEDKWYASTPLQPTVRMNYNASYGTGYGSTVSFIGGQKLGEQIIKFAEEVEKKQKDQGDMVGYAVTANVIRGNLWRNKGSKGFKDEAVTLKFSPQDVQRIKQGQNVSLLSQLGDGLLPTFYAWNEAKGTMIAQGRWAGDLNKWDKIPIGSNVSWTRLDYDRSKLVAHALFVSAIKNDTITVDGKQTTVLNETLSFGRKLKDENKALLRQHILEMTIDLKSLEFIYDKMIDAGYKLPNKY